MAQQEGGSASGPTVLRILLGAQLRKLREAKGVTRDEAGWEIRSSESKISRMELGRVSFKERDVADLLTFYGVSDEQERATMLALAREANTPGWWNRFTDILPTWFQSYLGLEAAAALIRTYEIQFVPGLLQTDDYARAVILLAHDRATADDVERRVALRRERQQALLRKEPPELWAVVDEAALRRPIGGDAGVRPADQAPLQGARPSHPRPPHLPFPARAAAGAGGGGARPPLRPP